MNQRNWNEPQIRIINNAALRDHKVRNTFHTQGTPLHGGLPTGVEILFLAGALMTVTLLQ
jgi:hypothetical protein